MHNAFIHTRAAVSAGMRAKAASGFVIGSARIGYVAIRPELGVTPVPDPIAAPLLAGAFRMAREGAAIRTITARLQAGGLCGKRGEPVSLATLQRTLTDPYYCGLVRNGAGEWVRGVQKEIVSPAVFATVQRRLLSRRCSPVKANETPQPEHQV